jgi:hypothetical protein
MNNPEQSQTPPAPKSDTTPSRGRLHASGLVSSLPWGGEGTGPWGCRRKRLNSFGAVITVVGVTIVGVTPLEVVVLIGFAHSGNDPVPEGCAMYESPLKRVRRRVGVGMFSVVVVGTLWSVWPGLPVLREPSAPAQLKQTGLELFRHDWEPYDPQAHGDGLGPVYNAQSCVACHSQGGIGGAGDNSHNVSAFEAFPTQDRPEIKGGARSSLRNGKPVPRGEQGTPEPFPAHPPCDPGDQRLPDRGP